MDLKLIDTLIEHEMALEELYSRYSEKFLSGREFFKKLAAQERKHAHFLQILKTKIASGEAILNQGKIKEVAVVTSVKYVRDKIEEARGADIDLIKTLVICNSIEQALIESSLANLFITDNVDARRMIDEIDAETRQHSALIKKALESAKEKANAK